MEVKEALVIRMNDILKEKNLKICTLAREARVSPSSVYSFMNDSQRKDVGILLIKKLCDSLNISLKEFFDADIFSTLPQEIY